jgi:four helix bundle protein
MSTIKRFEDLECWQASRELVRLIYSLTRSTRFSKDFELVSQIRRSAVSAMANIAEGFHRKSTKDFLKFLDYSRTSVAETISHGYVAFDQGYITESEMNELHEKTDIVWRKVNGFITYLNKKTV